jgi:hypothetical protein
MSLIAKELVTTKFSRIGFGMKVNPYNSIKESNYKRCSNIDNVRIAGRHRNSVDSARNRNLVAGAGYEIFAEGRDQAS